MNMILPEVIPSGRFRKLLYGLSIAFFLAALPSSAQFSGYSIPQVTQQTAFNAVTCTGSQQTASISNFGQTEHYLTITTSGGVVGFRASVQGSHDGTTFNDISDVATTSSNTVMGQGYYPAYQVSVTCATAVGTFTAKYSGQATGPAPQIGALFSAQIDKTIAVGVGAGSNFTSQTLRTPFGNTGGALFFSYAGAGPTNSILNVNCSTLAISSTVTIANFPLGSAAGSQFFPVSAQSCDFATIGYTSGGASATTFTLSYVFNSTTSGGDPCQASTVPKKSLAISATATTKLVTELTGHAVFICGYQFTLASGASPVATAQFTAGTGATCGTGTTNLTGTMAGIASSTEPIVSAGGGYTISIVSAGNALCIALGGTTPSAQGIVTVIQQ